MAANYKMNSTETNPNKVTKRVSFDIYDMRYEEEWLNAMGKEGLMLRKVTAALPGKRYHFDKTDKDTIRYSIIPKTLDEISDEESELFKSAGWSPACEKGYTYYYTDNPDAEPIFSDEESYRQYFRKQFKHTAMSATFYVIGALAWIANFRLRITGSSGLENLGYTSLCSDIAALVSYACLVIYWMIYAAYIIKSRREYMTGSYSELPKALWIIRLKNAVMTTVLLLLILTAPAILFTGKTEIPKNELFSYSGNHPVLMRTVFPDEWGFAEKRIKDPKTMEIIPAENGHGRVGVSIEYDYLIQDTSNLFLDRGYAESLYTSGGTISPLDTAEDEEPDKGTQEFIDDLYDVFDSDAPKYSSLYYEFRSEEKANKLIKREIENHVDTLEIELGGKDLIRAKKPKSKSLQGEDAMEAVRIDVPEIDYAGFIDERALIPETNGNGFQYLYLRKGNKVVYVSYSGKHDLMEKIDIFVEEFEEE